MRRQKKTKKQKQRSDQIRRDVVINDAERMAELPKSVQWAIKHKPYTG